MRCSLSLRSTRQKSSCKFLRTFDEATRARLARASRQHGSLTSARDHDNRARMNLGNGREHRIAISLGFVPSKAHVRWIVPVFSSAVLLVACGPRREMVTVCTDPEKCRKQQPLCDNSCEHSMDRSACRTCCSDMLRACENCKPGGYSFGTCQ